MDAVDDVSGDIHSGVETEGHVGAVDIVVNGLWQMNDIKSLFPEKIGCLLCAVSAQDNEAVKTKLLVCVFHGCDLVKSVLIRHSHKLKRLS